MKSRVLATLFAIPALLAGQDANALMQTLEKALLSLKPEGFEDRRVVFETVQPLGGGKFRVMGAIWDYGAGFPRNGYFGQTCVGRIPGWDFVLVPAANGQWQVNGRMTPTDTKTCKDNPAAGQAAIPFASLAGRPAPQGAVAPPAPGAAGQPPMGEWACYGTGGRLLAGLAFHLQRDGTYLDGDRRPSGRWSLHAASRTITFTGGHLSGQSGRNVSASGMSISNTVSCEPWR